MAAMIVRVDMEAERCHRPGKARVAAGPFGEAMADMDDAARPFPDREADVEE